MSYYKTNSTILLACAVVSLSAQDNRIVPSHSTSSSQQTSRSAQNILIPQYTSHTMRSKQTITRRLCGDSKKGKCARAVIGYISGKLACIAPWCIAGATTPNDNKYSDIIYCGIASAAAFGIHGIIRKLFQHDKWFTRPYYAGSLLLYLDVADTPLISNAVGAFAGWYMSTYDNPKKYGAQYSSMKEAIENHDEQGVEKLLQLEDNNTCNSYMDEDKDWWIDPEQIYKTPLHNAIMLGNARIVAWLLKHGAGTQLTQFRFGRISPCSSPATIAEYSGTLSSTFDSCFCMGAMVCKNQEKHLGVFRTVLEHYCQTQNKHVLDIQTSNGNNLLFVFLSLITEELQEGYTVLQNAHANNEDGKESKQEHFDNIKEYFDKLMSELIYYMTPEEIDRVQDPQFIDDLCQKHGKKPYNKGLMNILSECGATQSTNLLKRRTHRHCLKGNTALNSAKNKNLTDISIFCHDHKSN